MPDSVRLALPTRPSGHVDALGPGNAVGLAGHQLRATLLDHLTEILCHLHRPNSKHIYIYVIICFLYHLSHHIISIDISILFLLLSILFSHVPPFPQRNSPCLFSEAQASRSRSSSCWTDSSCAFGGHFNCALLRVMLLHEPQHPCMIRLGHGVQGH